MLDLGQHGGGLEQEVAAVPEIALGHVAGGGGGVGLLDEGVDRAHGAAVERRARPDVAVVGRRMRRRDAEGDDLPLRRGGGGLPAGGAELVGLADDVVGRQHQHDRVRRAASRQHGGDRHGGAGIAPHRLEHDVRLDAALAQLLGDDEAEVGIGDDDRPRRTARGSATRASTCWNVESGPTSGTNCLGMLSRETGHSRVPAPPHMITGTMRDAAIQMVSAVCRIIAARPRCRQAAIA